MPPLRLLGWLTGAVLVWIFMDEDDTDDDATDEAEETITPES